MPVVPWRGRDQEHKLNRKSAPLVQTYIGCFFSTASPGLHSGRLPANFPFWGDTRDTGISPKHAHKLMLPYNISCRVVAAVRGSNIQEREGDVRSAALNPSTKSSSELFAPLVHGARSVHHDARP